MVKLIKAMPIICPNQQTRYRPMGNTFISDVMNTINTLDNSQIKAASIDGYIVDIHGNVTRLLLKREFSFEQYEGFNQIAENKNIFLEFDEIKVLKEGYRLLASQLGCGIDFLFIPWSYPYEDLDNDPDKAYMVLYRIEPPPLNSAKFEFISANEYAARINTFRERSFRNSKPLKVASTYLECYLANDDKSEEKNPFAGDIDLFVYQGEKSKLIIEFKTHNLTTPIADEYFNKYATQDERRIQVLVDLANATDSKVLFVFWGVKHNEVKVQLISKDRNVISQEVFEKSPDLLSEYIISKSDV